MDKAVAVKYLSGMPAPFVVAKGRENLARRLIEMARDHGVEVLEMPRLAESLFVLETGDWIPEEYFEVIAEVLAFVYQLKAAE
ncbi:MAG TPA: EscU/YscU/HrcU family type III secretion system export apparatus switch protein [Spirochaetia bacterium]|nr:EscU/YscU/HrcU family type III secretion system export apparatus switch protein [Spirochaetia bacterium]